MPPKSSAKYPRHTNRSRSGLWDLAVILDASRIINLSMVSIWILIMESSDPVLTTVNWGLRVKVNYLWFSHPTNLHGQHESCIYLLAHSMGLLSDQTKFLGSTATALTLCVNGHILSNILTVIEGVFSLLKRTEHAEISWSGFYTPRSGLRNTDLNSHVLGLQFKRTLEDPLPHNKEDHISLFYLPSRSSEKFRLLPDLKHSAFHVSFTLERVAFATLSFSICDLPQILLCVSFRGMFPVWVTEIGFKLAIINRPDSQENADHSIYNLSLAASCTKCIIICCI